MKTARRWRRIEHPDLAYGYVRKAMLNTELSRRRARRVVEVPVAAVSDSYGPAGPDPDGAGRILPALMQLPPRMRAAVVLRYYEDLTEAETARALGCSVGTVKSQTSRALAHLRAHLATPPSEQAPLRRSAS